MNHDSPPAEGSFAPYAAGSRAGASGESAVREDAKSYLFSGLHLASPIEELGAVAERKRKMYANLGEEENARRVVEALELARTKLEAALARTPGRGAAGAIDSGACPACAPPCVDAPPAGGNGT